MKYKIVLVPFPFDDFSAIKPRPALCLTDTIGQHNHIVIAFITSQIPFEKSATDIVLEKNNETGLKVNSLIRLHRLVTIPEKLIKRELGKIPVDKTDELKNKLRELFEL